MASRYADDGKVRLFYWDKERRAVRFYFDNGELLKAAVDELPEETMALALGRLNDKAQGLSHERGDLSYWGERHGLEDPDELLERPAEHRWCDGWGDCWRSAEVVLHTYTRALRIPLRREVCLHCARRLIQQAEMYQLPWWSILLSEESQMEVA